MSDGLISACVTSGPPARVSSSVASRTVGPLSFSMRIEVPICRYSSGRFLIQRGHAVARHAVDDVNASVAARRANASRRTATALKAKYRAQDRPGLRDVEGSFP